MTEERPRKRRAVATHSNGNHVPDSLLQGVHGISMRPATALSHHQQQRQRQSEYQRELDVVRFEVEPVKVKTPSNTHAVKYVPTMRGMLGQKGYLLREKLGKGSYSQVRMAVNVPRLQTVAIKIVDKTLAPQDFRERFLPRELEIWPRLRHPHIVRMFHHFEDTRRIYAVLEYAPGGDALRFIQKRGALSTDHAKIWMLQLGDAVRYLHQQDVAHRDLKLENLILDAASNIKLCDFGFARECGSDLSSTYCGSKSYAAPEILNGTQYDPKKADIWALGVILFIFVTGKMPFDERKGNTGLLEDHKSLKFFWPTKVSDQCKEVILSSLKFEYSSRLDIVAFLSQVWFQTLSGAPYSCPRQVLDVPVAQTTSDQTTHVSSHNHQRHHSATSAPAADMSARHGSEYRTHTSSHPHRQHAAATGHATSPSHQRHSHHQTLVTMSPDGQR
ncbi:testis-specific serine/threonine-protein kinase 6-like [Lineus longissimus]|uniref:testis-specific serine/threonine-protein kinase 6-like n=1 Tax=Lineus longissimus TaxID=88925 RepID=UPI00315D43C9